MTAQADFLEKAGWRDAEVAPIASDASDRRYLRLRRDDGATAVLMLAPVAASGTARQQFDAFRRIGAWLRGLGLGAPSEIAADPAAGLMLLEDLGAAPLSGLLESGATEAAEAYRAAVDVLSRVARAEPPDGLARPDPADLAAMTGPTFDCLPGSGALRIELQKLLAARLATIAEQRTVALRDVHGDNLIWRSGREGPARIGLLDFQDALIMPEGYDLASLLDDPRRVVPESWRRGLLASHADARGMPEDAMALRVDLLSLQRNIRILGIFRRLAAEMGRPAYSRFQPRTRALIARAAAHPELSDLRPHVADLLDRTAHWQEDAA